MAKPKIFISYCHGDQAYKDKLEAHLTPLKINQVADVWFDGLIKPGDEWESSIDRNIMEADIILLLISVSFINSGYCYSIELRKALERHENGAARVIPIILSHCYWENQSFSRLQALPNNGRPISSFADHDEAYTKIVSEIHSAIKSATIPINDSNLSEKREKEEVKWIDEREASINSANIIMPWREYWNQLNKAASILGYCEYTPDFIFGIANGGLVVADFISRLSYPNIPVFSLWADRLRTPSQFFTDSYNSPLLDKITSNSKKTEIFLLDDNISSGHTFIEAVVYLKSKIPQCHIAYMPLFTKRKTFMDISFMDKCLIWNHAKVRPYLAKDFDIIAMHFTNYYDFPYGKGIKNIN